MTPPWFKQAISRPDGAFHQMAEARQAQLTKPPGSLGMLETLAIRLAALQRSPTPDPDPVRIVVFAADHGIARAGVSAFPQAVTLEMVRNFARGGAAINVLARAIQASLEVVDVGVLTDPGPLPGVVSQRIGPGTADFRIQPAMSEIQLRQALQAGADAVKRAKEAGIRLFIGGEMGIGNTSAATAIFAALLGLAPDSVVGPGTGVDSAGLSRKLEAIQSAIDFHLPFLANPLEIMRRLGGFEIAALCGAYVACAQAGIPVMVDGIIASAAALVAVTMRPQVKEWLFFGHRSAEPGHLSILHSLEIVPILQLDMRLGEGSGAAAAVPILRLACALHREMATFAEAGVSGKES